MRINNKVLDIYRPKNETLNDAFDRFVVKIHHQNRMYGHKTFVLTGCEPMVGTTTIAINVAISLAMSGLKTILIDGDLRKDGKFKRLGDTVEMGLSDVLSGNVDLASSICATNYVTLDYLPSGIKDENPVGLLYSPNLDKVIEALSEYYDYVIFDLPSANAAIDSNIFASKVDAVILVAGQNSTNTYQIKNAKNELEKIAANLVGIVFNNVDGTEYRRYMKNYDYFNKEKFINITASKEEEEEVISNVVLDDSAFNLGYDQYKDDNLDDMDERNSKEVDVTVPTNEEYEENTHKSYEEEEYVQEEYVGEEYTGEEYVQEEYVQEEYVQEEYMGDEYVGDKYEKEEYSDKEMEEEYVSKETEEYTNESEEQEAHNMEDEDIDEAFVEELVKEYVDNE